MKEVANKSRSAFIAVEHLIDQCLTSKKKVDALEESDSEEIAPGFETFLNIFWENSADILPYVVLFLVPVIRNVKSSNEIFGDPKHAMAILSMLIQLLPLCTGLEHPPYLK